MSGAWTRKCGWLVLTALGLLAGPARADELDVLEQEFEVVARRVDERGWEAQAELLDRIADLRTPQARRTLERLRDRWAERDWRRAGLILGALVKHAGTKDVDEAIAWAEKHKDPLLLEMLGDALARTQSPTARMHLREDALRRAPPPVKAQIARAIGRLKDAEALPALLRAAGESDVAVRTEALYALGLIGDGLATTPVALFLKDEDARIRDVAAQALGLLGDPEGAEPLCRALGDPNARVVESAALSLALLGRPACIDRLIAVLKILYPGDLRTADGVAEALERITGERLGLDGEAWQAWWDGVKDRPFEKRELPPGERTVPGLPYYGFRLRSSKVVFVIDVSRSMEWNGRLERAKSELIRVVESLPETTSFNIVVYSDGVDAWQKGIVPATRQTIRRAVEFVERLSPQDGTDVYDALRIALADPDADTIFFLSDGSPSTGPVVEPDRILAEVRSWNRYRRVCIQAVALVIGTPPQAFAGTEDERRSIEFMTRLAEQNHGTAEVVREALVPERPR